MGIAVASREQYKSAIRRLFPQGAYWDAQFADAGSDVSLFCEAKLDELLHFRGRMSVLQDESSIETTNELIADWERVILDEVKTGDLAARRLTLKQKQDVQLNRAELDKTAGMYGFSIADIEFPYRPAFLGHAVFGQQRVCGFSAFSVLRFTLTKDGLIDEIAAVHSADWAERGFGRLRCGHDRMAYLPVSDGEVTTPQLVNFVIHEKKLFNEFEGAVKGKMLANQIAYFWYEGV
jgi:hypothetical protein